MTVNSLLEAPAHILKAISSAANKTGADFAYLVKTASRESSFQESASASNSSATGLFQFVENTWLETLKESGPQFGLSSYAAKITKTPEGNYRVPGKTARDEILRLRNDPKIASIMAGAYTQKNAAYVKEQTGRTPTKGEIYLAHFLGPQGAVRMIQLEQSQPTTAAKIAFPAAARTNPNIFSSHNGDRTIREVYELLTQQHDGAGHENESTPTANKTQSVPGQATGPLISRAPISPLTNLFGISNANLGTRDGVWGTLLQSNETSATDAKSEETSGLSSKSRAIQDDQSQTAPTEQAWVGEGGWRVTVRWVDLRNTPGSNKNIKA